MYGHNTTDDKRRKALKNAGEQKQRRPLLLCLLRCRHSPPPALVLWLSSQAGRVEASGVAIGLIHVMNAHKGANAVKLGGYRWVGDALTRTRMESCVAEDDAAAMVVVWSHLARGIVYPLRCLPTAHLCTPTHAQQISRCVLRMAAAITLATHMLAQAHATAGETTRSWSVRVDHAAGTALTACASHVRTHVVT